MNIGEFILSPDLGRKLTPVEIVERAIEFYKPVAIYVGFSGGNDTRWHWQAERPCTNNPVWPIYEASQSGSGEADKARIDTLQHESWDLRAFSIGEEDVGWRVIEHHMAAPHERVVAEIFKDDPRAAIDAARAAMGGKDGASVAHCREGE